MSICWASVRWPGRQGKRLFGYERPVHSNDPLVCEPFQRLGKKEIGRAFSLFEPDDSEIRPALALQNCHHAILLYLRLEVTIRSRLLPESISLRLTAFFDDSQEPRRFYFKEFHNSYQAVCLLSSLRAGRGCAV